MVKQIVRNLILVLISFGNPPIYFHKCTLYSQPKKLACFATKGERVCEDFEILTIIIILWGDFHWKLVFGRDFHTAENRVSYVVK